MRKTHAQIYTRHAHDILQPVNSILRLRLCAGLRLWSGRKVRRRQRSGRRGSSRRE